MSEFREAIEYYRDFPKPGVTFFDTTPLHLHQNAVLWTQALDTIAGEVAHLAFSAVAAIESKGFIFGARGSTCCTSCTTTYSVGAVVQYL